MRKHLYPIFQETMQTYYELPPGSDGKIQFLDFMTFSFEAQESFTRNLPKYRKQRSTIRHWKTCTEAVMKKLT